MVVTEKGPELPGKLRLHIDEPMVGTVNDLSETASVIGKWKPPEHEQDEPDMLTNIIDHDPRFGNQGKKELVRLMYSEYSGFFSANDLSSMATPDTRTMR